MAYQEQRNRFQEDEWRQRAQKLEKQVLDFQKVLSIVQSDKPFESRRSAELAKGLQFLKLSNPRQRCLARSSGIGQLTHATVGCQDQPSSKRLHSDTVVKTEEVDRQGDQEAHHAAEVPRRLGKGAAGGEVHCRAHARGGCGAVTQASPSFMVDGHGVIDAR